MPGELVVDRYRAEIERGLGAPAARAMERSLNDVMGWPWEEAFRWHLRRLVAEGEIRDDVVTIGSWWNRDGRVACADLDRRSTAVPGRAHSPVFVVCARSSVSELPAGALGITAADVFGGRHPAEVFVPWPSTWRRARSSCPNAATPDKPWMPS